MHQRKFKGHSVSTDRKTDLGSNKASSKNLSPSQTIIREFKKSEIKKYGASPSCPDAPSTITTEWQVLYTTHLTQKAKKFHDGFLKLAICGSQRRQVMLYDETRRLLDSRFLKTDEIIRSGESLMLEGHLVDIGELDRDQEPLTCSNVLGSNVSGIEKEILHVHQVKKLKIKKNTMEKSEICEQDASPGCPDALKSSGTEWEVLYTTQVTQKSKKFHDGILKLTVGASQRRQVFLYDASGRLLDSRFLKISEVISSGDSLKLDGHLVEIGEHKVDQKPIKDSNLQGKNCVDVGDTKVFHEQVQTHANYPVEWDAMYTTQITQKSKKNHTGILRLSSCGSYKMQITLLAEDGTSLSRRYLKLSEHLSSGSTCELSNYLVEIGEQRKHSDEHLQTGISVLKENDLCIRNSSVENVKLNARVPAKKSSSNELESNGSRGKELDLTVRSSQAEYIRPSRETFTNKSLRDAHAILSILKKPDSQEGIVFVKREPVEVCNASQTSDFTHFDIQNGVEGQHVVGPRSRGVMEGNKNQEVINVDNFDVSNINPSGARGDTQTKIITSSNSHLGSRVSNFSRPVFDSEFSDSSSRSYTSSILNPQVINGDYDCQTTVSVTHNGSSKNEQKQNIPESLYSKAASSFTYSQPFGEVYSGSSSQMA